ncbi:DJ-1/PfpI family protein [Cytophaga aurantiaca]|uniref:DJ-1/PfpI family protein n=1 Tax=Cytophaga aurantiaca TaxID=29530 RepID=UPI0003A11345|nr:DJ-1/PfpI family protein [Cytophaga aurantiaca]
MRVAYIIFDKITWLDFFGIYDPISRLKSMNYLPNLKWDICAFTNTVVDSFGLEVRPNKIKNPLSDYDAIIIPGGLGTRTLQYDTDFINWIKTAENVKYKISICTGSLILGAAGFLIDKQATTNYQEYKALEQYCQSISTDRIVEDSNVITSGAVSASIDLGLYLCNKWSGHYAEQEIRKKMDYNG